MLTPHWRKVLLCSCLFAALTVLGTGLARVAAKSATEAPAGFNTPSFDGAQSLSNGIVEPPGDTYARDQEVYEENHSVQTGLGPVYNATACVSCHQNPNSGGARNHSVQTGLGPVYNATACVSCHQNPNSGGASQFTELRVGHKDENGNFVNPTIFINDGQNTITGRSIVNDRAIGPEAQEHIPATENIRALRAALNTLGDGFVEAIDDKTLIAIAEGQPELSEGRIHGEVVQAPIFEAPGQTRVGRFGWKDQHSSLLSFIGDAYLNEMGITNRLRPTDVTTVLKTTKDPEDVPDGLGLADIDHFAQFIRGTMVPPRDTALAATPAAIRGGELFSQVGCGVCHVQSITTAPAGTVIDGGLFIVPDALGIRLSILSATFCCMTSEPEMGLSRLARKTRPTNYGLRHFGACAQSPASCMTCGPKPRFMHDLRSLSLEDAIARHDGEAREPAKRFKELSPEERQALITFLKTL